MAKLVALSMGFAGAIFPARAPQICTEAEEEASPRTDRKQHETCFDSPRFPCLQVWLLSSGVLSPFLARRRWRSIGAYKCQKG